MSFSISIGDRTRASGFGCISVGDGAETRGAFQVDVKSKITFPPMTVEKAQEMKNALLDLLQTYEAFERDGFAPAGFTEKAKYAVDLAITVLHDEFIDNKGKEEEDDVKVMVVE